MYIGGDRVRAHAAWDVFAPRFLCPTDAICRADTVTGCGYTLYIPPDPSVQPSHIVLDRLCHVALEVSSLNRSTKHNFRRLILTYSNAS